MKCKQTAELNTIHAMTVGQLAAEQSALKGALRGYLTTADRSHKTNRLQLVSRYLDIRRPS